MYAKATAASDASLCRRRTGRAPVVLDNHRYGLSVRDPQSPLFSDPRASDGGLQSAMVRSVILPDGFGRAPARCTGFNSGSKVLQLIIGGCHVVEICVDAFLACSVCRRSCNYDSSKGSLPAVFVAVLSFVCGLATAMVWIV